VQELLKKLDKPLVIDADALHATFLDKVKSKIVICTPHKKEYEVLMKNNKNKIPKHVVILKKGAVDEIITEKKVYYNKTGVPEMAVAGTGDILAGMCASFLAQKLAPEKAACSAAFFNGFVGQRAQKDFGNFTANEILFYIKP
jgi:NAD(P)H-hydrate epimerase